MEGRAPDAVANVNRREYRRTDTTEFQAETTGVRILYTLTVRYDGHHYDLLELVIKRTSGEHVPGQDAQVQSARRIAPNIVVQETTRAPRLRDDAAYATSRWTDTDVGNVRNTPESQPAPSARREKGGRQHFPARKSLKGTQSRLLPVEQRDKRRLKRHRGYSRKSVPGCEPTA